MQRTLQLGYNFEILVQRAVMFHCKNVYDTDLVVFESNLFQMSRMRTTKSVEHKTTKTTLAVTKHKSDFFILRPQIFTALSCTVVSLVHRRELYFLEGGM